MEGGRVVGNERGGSRPNGPEQVLACSISRRKEYGAMICRKAGKYVALKARTQDEPNKVAVGQNEENCGCPRGATPVAYYHTHPLTRRPG